MCNAVQCADDLFLGMWLSYKSAVNNTVESNTDVYSYNITNNHIDSEAEFMSKTMAYTMYEIGKCSLSNENSLIKCYEDIYLPAMIGRLTKRFLFNPSSLIKLCRKKHSYLTSLQKVLQWLSMKTFSENFSQNFLSKAWLNFLIDSHFKAI